MAHWLDGLTRLFTCESTDLADLAVVAGYDPTDFYRGTLADDVVRNDVLKIGPNAETSGPRMFDGDFGICVVNVPTRFRELKVLRLEAVLFPTIGDLNRAFLNGALNGSFVAVIAERSAVGKTEDTTLIAPALDMLRDHGSAVAMILDANLSNHTAVFPIAASFKEPIFFEDGTGKIANDNVIEFDFENRRLFVRYLEGPTSVSKGVAAYDLLAGRTDNLVGAARELNLHAQNVTMLAEVMSRPKRRRKNLHHAHFRMLQYTCQQLRAVIGDIDTRVPNAMQPDIAGLPDRLLYCARSAFDARHYRACEAAIDLAIQLPPFETTELANFRRVTNLTLLGDVAAAEKDPLRAIGIYSAARSTLDTELDASNKTIPANHVMVELEQRIARQARKAGRNAEAIETLEFSVERLRMLTEYMARVDDYITLGEVCLELSYLSQGKGDLRDAAWYIDEALRSLTGAMQQESSWKVFSKILRGMEEKVRFERKFGEADSYLKTLLTAVSVGSLINSHFPNRPQARSLSKLIAEARLQPPMDNSQIRAVDTGSVARVREFLAEATWAPEEIAERSKYLANVLVEIWGPVESMVMEVERSLRGRLSAAPTGEMEKSTRTSGGDPSFVRHPMAASGTPICTPRK